MRTAVRPGVEGAGGPGHDLLFDIGGMMERVVRDDDHGAVRRLLPQNIGDKRGLRRRDPSALMIEAIGGVEADDMRGSGLHRRFSLPVDPAAIGRTGCQQACRQVEQRDVMIARHGDPFLRQAIQKPARLPKLTGAGALHEIPGDDDQIGGGFRHRIQQRVYQIRTGAAKVQVGQQNKPHQVSFCAAAGTLTTSASLMARNRYGPAMRSLSPSRATSRLLRWVSTVMSLPVYRT